MSPNETFYLIAHSLTASNNNLYENAETEHKTQLFPEKNCARSMENPFCPCDSNVVDGGVEKTCEPLSSKDECLGREG